VSGNERRTSVITNSRTNNLKLAVWCYTRIFAYVTMQLLSFFFFDTLFELFCKIIDVFPTCVFLRYTKLYYC